jgi:ornithine decarboxylase
MTTTNAILDAVVGEHFSTLAHTASPNPFGIKTFSNLYESKPVSKDVFPAPCSSVDRGSEADAKVLSSWQLHHTGKVAAAGVITDLGTTHVKSGGYQGMSEQGLKFILEHDLDESFYVMDLGNVLRLLKAWRAAMPRVQPFYAVKCNPEPGMLKLMAAMGTGFDCASKREVETMLNMGVHPSRIIFAHPCKRKSDILYAREMGVAYTTFDTVSELHKIATLNPDFKLVLRIRADDPDARVPLGLKYGADVEDVQELLRTASELNLSIVGVSFHVGSSCKNLETFSMAIERARAIFDEAETYGFKMELLDIGGGFTGHFDECGNVMFGEIASTINAAIALHFPPEGEVRVIAEPGRYFAETSAAIFTPVYGKRQRIDPVTKAVKKDYFITDGLYGSFNCMLYDGQNPEYAVLRSPCALTEEIDETVYPSTIWGPTCDSADVLYKDVQMPHLRNGDWLMWERAGAYTWAGACDFNGIEFTKPRRFYILSDSAVDV